MPTYNAIGLMSGSSLDGLDIAFVRLHEDAGSWRYEWIATDCCPYPQEWLAALRSAKQLSVPDFLELHTRYGHFTGTLVNQFLVKNGSPQRPDLIASHGHTVHHNPVRKTSTQIGDGAAIAAVTGITTITDLRNMDVALGGQGAPIVPIGDRLLFGGYDALLNLGGIANISIRNADGSYTAFDICPCNQLLNFYAEKTGEKFDAAGKLARGGTVQNALLERLSANAFYQTAAPKSLANEFSAQQIIPEIEKEALSVENALATCNAHIAAQIVTAVESARPERMLVTGGGAFNTFLIETLRRELSRTGTEMVVPEPELISYKEALVMALIGALRWRNEVNVYASVTGASRNSTGGALWAGL